MGRQRHAPAEPRLVHCKWWKKGHCYRGDACYFRHDPSLLGIAQKPDAAATAMEIDSIPPAAIQIPGRPTDAPPPGNPPVPVKEPEQCSICMETPKVYGLLVRCDHVFCLECIRRWRGSKKADKDVDDEPGSSDIWGSVAIKSCPLCRKPSKFIIPSAVFPTPPVPEATSSTVPSEDGPNRSNGKAPAVPNPLKESIIKEYTRNLKRIPCRYFEEAIKSWKAKVKREAELGKKEPPFRPICYFVNKCHYAHIHPTTNKPYIFEKKHIAELERRRRKRKRADGEWQRPDNDDFFIDAIRANIRATSMDVEGYPVDPPALEGEDDENDWGGWDLYPSGVLPHTVPLSVWLAYHDSEVEDHTGI
ncbi:hypothetical protein FQN49_008001 [Arthroderma sp. PD_2]|nr:hypothetical protein FQN49_008001 [Arthroderma sp. PD_2]